MLDIFLSILDSTSLPKTVRNHLHSLFDQIETEFSAMYAENVELKKNVRELTEKLNNLDSNHLSGDKVEANQSNGSDGQKVNNSNKILSKVIIKKVNK